MAIPTAILLFRGGLAWVTCPDLLFSWTFGLSSTQAVPFAFWAGQVVCWCVVVVVCCWYYLIVQVIVLLVIIACCYDLLVLFTRLVIYILICWFIFLSRFVCCCWFTNLLSPGYSPQVVLSLSPLSLYSCYCCPHSERCCWYWAIVGDLLYVVVLLLPCYLVIWVFICCCCWFGGVWRFLVGVVHLPYLVVVDLLRSSCWWHCCCWPLLVVICCCSLISFGDLLLVVTSLSLGTFLYLSLLSLCHTRCCYITFIVVVYIWFIWIYIYICCLLLHIWAVDVSFNIGCPLAHVCTLRTFVYRLFTLRLLRFIYIRFTRYTCRLHTFVTFALIFLSILSCIPHTLFTYLICISYIYWFSSLFAFGSFGLPFGYIFSAKHSCTHIIYLTVLPTLLHCSYPTSWFWTFILQLRYLCAWFYIPFFYRIYLCMNYTLYFLSLVPHTTFLHPTPFVWPLFVAFVTFSLSLPFTLIYV